MFTRLLYGGLAALALIGLGAGMYYLEFPTETIAATLGLVVLLAGLAYGIYALYPRMVAAYARARATASSVRTRASTARAATATHLTGLSRNRLLVELTLIISAVWVLAAFGLMGELIQAIAINVIGISAGFFLILFAIPVVAPGLIHKLVIKPNKHRPAGWSPGDAQYEVNNAGFFTDLQPGRVKIKITRFGGFVTCLMNWQGRHFIGEEANDFQPSHQEYWKVVKSDDAPDSHPLPLPEPKGRWKSGMWWLWVSYLPMSLLWWGWKRWVYQLTGAVWVGIPAFRTLRFYWLDRYEMHEDEHGNTTLLRRCDWSDHYRVADFQFGILIPSADTSNMVEVEVKLNQISKVVNPYLVAFNTDDKWGARLNGVNTDAVNLFTRPKNYQDVVAAKDDAGAFMEFVTKKAKEKVDEIGIEVVETQLIDATVKDPTLRSQLAEPARAQAEKDAAELRADGNAAPIRKMGQALRDFPEASIIPGIEGMVRATQVANPNAFIFIGDPRTYGGVNGMDAAQVREHRAARGATPGNPAGAPAAAPAAAPPTPPVPPAPPPAAPPQAGP